MSADTDATRHFFRSVLFLPFGFFFPPFHFLPVLLDLLPDFFDGCLQDLIADLDFDVVEYLLLNPLNFKSFSGLSGIVSDHIVILADESCGDGGLHPGVIFGLLLIDRYKDAVCSMLGIAGTPLFFT